MAAYCDFEGIEFEYPDNWTLEESYSKGSSISGEGWPQIAVSGPETAIWQLSKHLPSASLETLYDEALSVLRAEYREIEVEAVDTAVDGCQLSGYDVNFYCLDLTVTAWLRGFARNNAIYLLVCQAEDRELMRVGPVFEAMLVSLLRHMDQAKSR